MKPRVLRIILFSLSFILVFNSCAFRGREKKDIKFSQDEEIKFGNYLDEIIMSMYIPYRDDRVQRALDALLRDLSVHSPKKIPYRIKVLISIEPNTFSTPDGNIYITTGLLDILDKRCEVAAAIAREIGHIVYSHHIKMYLEEAKRKGGAEIVTSIFNLVKSQLPGFSEKGAKMALSSVTSIVTRKGYTKKMEMEADRFSAYLLEQSGFSPACLISYLKKLYKAERKTFKGVGLLSSSRKFLRERIEKLEGSM